MALDTDGRPTPLNNPFDKSASVLDLEVIAKSKGLKADEVEL